MGAPRDEIAALVAQEATRIGLAAMPAKAELFRRFRRPGISRAIGYRAVADGVRLAAERAAATGPHPAEGITEGVTSSARPADAGGVSIIDIPHGGNSPVPDPGTGKGVVPSPTVSTTGGAEDPGTCNLLVQTQAALAVWSAAMGRTSTALDTVIRRADQVAAAIAQAQVAFGPWPGSPAPDRCCEPWWGCCRKGRKRPAT